MPSLPALQPEYRARLVRLLGMLGSDHDGERANAARLADEHRKRSGLTWGEIILPLAEDRGRRKPAKPRKPRKAKATKPAKPAPPPAPPWRDMATLVAESVLATKWERDFASGLLEKWRGALTEKQALCLEKLFAKCGGSAERAA
jgi:hypothetical protein